MLPLSDSPGAHCIVPAGMERVADHLSAPVKDVITTNYFVETIDYRTLVDAFVKTTWLFALTY